MSAKFDAFPFRSWDVSRMSLQNKAEDIGKMWRWLPRGVQEKEEECIVFYTIMK